MNQVTHTMDTIQLSLIVFINSYNCKIISLDYAQNVIVNIIKTGRKKAYFFNISMKFFIYDFRCKQICTFIYVRLSRLVSLSLAPI